MARVQVTSYGAALVARHIEGVARAADDIRPTQPAVTRQVAEGYSRSFGRQGPGWSPLKPSTIRRRLAEGYSSGPILQASGHYKSMATNPFALIVDAHNDGFDFTVDDEKSKWHQSGTSKMAQRRLTLSFGDRQAVIRVISDHIIRGYGI
jgi:hypothetical protein